MRLRRADLADMPAVAVLHRTTMRVSLPFLPELHSAEDDRRFFTEKLFPANAVWLAEDAAGLAGYAAAAPGWLNHLYVCPDRQGAGAGGLLLAHVMRDADELRLWTFQRNARAGLSTSRGGSPSSGSPTAPAMRNASPTPFTSGDAPTADLRERKARSRPCSQAGVSRRGSATWRFG